MKTNLKKTKIILIIIFFIILFITAFLIVTKTFVGKKASYEITGNDLSGIKNSCKIDSDCILTRELYSPCGSVSSVNKLSLTDKNILESNTFWEKYDEGADYKCGRAQQVENFKAICQKNTCGSLKIK